MKIKFFIIFLNLIFIECNSQKIFINSIPKCGTNLVIRCVELLTKRKATNINENLVTVNQLPKVDPKPILFWHVGFSEQALNIFKNNNFLGIFIYRDPRDRIISAAFWCLKYPHLLEQMGYKKGEKINFADLITKLIPITKKEYDKYLGWLGTRSVFFPIKFEHLVGPKGGGKSYIQQQTIKNICNHLKIYASVSTVNNCIKDLYGNTVTFREGKIGKWKNYFSAQHKKLFKQEFGNLLIRLGYEKNLNW